MEKYYTVATIAQRLSINSRRMVSDDGRSTVGLDKVSYRSNVSQATFGALASIPTTLRGRI